MSDPFDWLQQPAGEIPARTGWGRWLQRVWPLRPEDAPTARGFVLAGASLLVVGVWIIAFEDRWFDVAYGIFVMWLGLVWIMQIRSARTNYRRGYRQAEWDFHARIEQARIGGLDLEQFGQLLLQQHFAGVKAEIAELKKWWRP